MRRFDSRQRCNYNVIMRAKLISIGNSKGLRLPRAIIQQCGFGDEIEVEVKKDGLMIKAVKKPREGWEDSFREMHKNGDDRLLDEVDAHTETDWDQTEWTW